MPQALLPVSEALARILDGAARLESERIPLAEAAGRTLAEPLIAAGTQPPFRSSAMDGYAVRAADAVAGARLKRIGVAPAGRAFDGVLGPGEAVRIFTGGAVPAGADTILVQEDATAEDDTIVVNAAPGPGRFIRPEGLDFHAGDTLLAAGGVLTPRALALVAGTGSATVTVVRRPRVGILATGDELVPPGSEPGPAQIYASNAMALSALVVAQGGLVIDLGIAPDDIGAIREAAALARAQDADILVTTGGASVGERDLVRAALQEEGLTLDFWRIAMRPGRPLMAGALGAMRMIGMPGNPASAYVCGFLFLVPLLRALLGRRAVHHVQEHAILGAPLPANDHREDYLRACLDVSAALPVATASARQDSSMTRLLAEAECLIVRPAGDPPRAAGEPCRIIRFGENS